METELLFRGTMTELDFQKHGLELGYLDLERKAYTEH